MPFYIRNDDRIVRTFRDLLIEKARKGLQLRVMYDIAVGSLSLLNRIMADADYTVSEDFKQLPPGTRLVNAAAHLLSPLL